MDFVLRLIPNTLQEWAAAAAVIAALGALVKFLPNWIDARMAASLEAVYAAGGPYEDWLFTQFLIYLEMKYGPSANSEKAAQAVEWLVGKLPLKFRIFAGAKVRAKAAELVTLIFEKGKARIEATAKEHGGTPPLRPVI
jgi:hypothetical protein